MKTWAVRVLIRSQDRVDGAVYSFRAYGLQDALARFAAFRDRNLTFDDVEVIAVWQSSICECRRIKR